MADGPAGDNGLLAALLVRKAPRPDRERVRIRPLPMVADRAKETTPKPKRATLGHAVNHCDIVTNNISFTSFAPFHMKNTL